MRRSRWMALAFTLLLAGCGLNTATPPTAHKTKHPSTHHSASCAPLPAWTMSQPALGPGASGNVRLTFTEPRLTLNAVSFQSPTLGAVAGNGVILRTADGGACWQVAYHGASQLQGVEFSTKSVAYAFGTQHLLRSSDGGRSYQAVYTASQSTPIVGASFVGAEDGYLLLGGTTGSLMRTTDGGRTFTKIGPGGSSVDFVDAQHGWLTSGSNVYSTSDGGKTFNQVFTLPGTTTTFGSNYGMSYVRATSATNAWVVFVGGSGMSQTSYSVYHTTDGKNFSVAAAVSTAGAGPAPGGASGPKGPGSSPGPIAPLGSNGAILGGICRACGFGSITLATTTNGGSNWKVQPMLYGASGMPGKRALSFPNSRTGFLVMPVFQGESEVLATRDGGRTWQQIFPLSAPHPLRSISFVTASTGFGLGTVGNPGVVLRTEDGGSSWVPVGQLPQGTQTSIGAQAAISFVSSRRGFALGGDGRLYATTNGGATWTAALPANDRFYSLAFVSPRRGCALQLDSSSPNFATTDGGSSWSVATGSSLSCLTGLLQGSFGSRVGAELLAKSPYAAWLMADGSHMAWFPTGTGFIITTDGGVTFKTYQLPYFYGVGTLSFTGPRHGVILAQDGTLYSTSDGGTSFRQLPS